MLTIELERVNRIVHAFKHLHVTSVSYYGRTFKSLEEFLDYTDKKKS